MSGDVEGQVPPQEDEPGTDALAGVDSIILDNLPAMIAFWDTDQRNRFANEAYVEWFGVTPAQAEGMTLRELLGPRVYAMNRPYIEAALAGEPQVFERVLIDMSGRTRHVQAFYTPHRVDGVVRGMFVLVVDISARVAAEAALLESTEKVVLLHERERIATRLNQLVIRRLSRITMDLGGAAVVADPQTTGRIGSAIESLDEAISDLRSAIFALSPAAPAAPDATGAPQEPADSDVR